MAKNDAEIHSTATSSGNTRKIERSCWFKAFQACAA